MDVLRAGDLSLDSGKAKPTPFKTALCQATGLLSISSKSAFPII